MLINFELKNCQYKFDDQTSYNLTISLKKDKNVSCYHLDNPLFQFFKNDYFSGNLNEGGSVNCEKISYYAHASGTHTETALHVFNNGKFISDVEIPTFYLAQLITITPEKTREDNIITKETIENEINQNSFFDALIIRTLPNNISKKEKNYANTNPPYLSCEAAHFLKKIGIKHLLVDLPSIDKEDDEGKLAAHKAWFQNDDDSVSDRLITELIYINENIEDGFYVLKVDCPMIETDAVLSKIKIFPLI